MKLLSPSQNRDVQGQELQRQVMRLQEVATELKKANQSLSKAEDDFRVAMARNQAEWAAEEATHAEKRLTMVSEVEELEARRERALVPITVEQDRLDVRERELTEREEVVEGERERLEGLEDELEDKLDAVGQREVDVQDRENRVAVREKAADEQADMVRESTKTLENRWAELTASSALWDRMRVDTEKKLQLDRINLEAREEMLVRHRAELDTREKQLKDREETLARSMERIRLEGKG